jgi:hypothetical protein
LEHTCESRISRVVVHARGALVTRAVTLPEDLPSGTVDVVVPSLTALAQAGSLRAAIVGGARVVSSMKAELVMPDRSPDPGPTAKAVRDAAAAHERLVAERAVVSEQRERVGATKLLPALRAHDGKRERDKLDDRLADVAEMQRLVEEVCARLDDEVRDLDRQILDARKVLEAAKLEDEQASSASRMGTSHPTRTARVRLTGDGAPGTLEITYAVSAARWWPAYTLRLTQAGAAARWIFEAVVAQRTGEDWTDVPLALSSGDLVFDVRLPVLRSLRFSRAQAEPRRGYRPPPDGIESMFASYLAFGVGAFAAEARDISDAATTTEAELTRAIRDGFDEGAITRELLAVEGAYGGAVEEPDDADTVVFTGEVSAKSAGRRMSAQRVQDMPAPVEAMLGAPPAPAAMRMSSVPMHALTRGGAAFGGPAGGAAGAMREEYAAPPEPEIVPSDAWSDYDALVLANADDASSRGRLVRRPEQGARSMARQASAEIERAGSDRYQDPLETRGVFDHRYEAGASANVPADGRLHRVNVGARECPAEVTWLSVPAEAPEVYREATLTNPFETPLLGGPVDVYLDGSLLTTASIRRIDKGGTFRCGMGVDDRVKVARNVRASEESAGLLGGSIAVTHDVSIELTCAMKEGIRVDVRERVPVTDDKNIEVKLLSAEPTPEPYDQSERGTSLRGGRRFVVQVRPGQKTSIELSYRLVLPAKLDIVGGNRRG